MELSRERLATLLRSTGTEEDELFERSASVKQAYLDHIVYLRGLIELSNICEKDCFYCGIRNSNRELNRYRLTHKEVLDAIRFAHEKGFGSVAIQSGE
ncbi:MAG: Radical SAM domain protein, partial [Proteiniphilum sp. 51_7]